MVCFLATQWPRLSRKIRNSAGSLRLRLKQPEAQAVRSELSDFGFEMQDSSDFKISDFSAEDVIPEWGSHAKTPFVVREVMVEVPAALAGDKAGAR